MTRSTPSAARPIAPLLADYRDLHAELLETERELSEVVASARERAREADLLRFGLGEIEAVAPGGRARTSRSAEEEQRLGHADTLRTAAESARAALSSDDGGPDALAAVAAARTLLDGVRDHDQAAAGAGRPGRRAHLPAVRPRRRRRVLRLRPRDRPRPAGRRVGATRRADRADPQVRRDRGRRARLGRDLRRATGPARRHRRPDQSGSASGVTTCEAASAQSPRHCPRPARPRPPGSPPS